MTGLYGLYMKRDAGFLVLEGGGGGAGYKIGKIYQLLANVNLPQKQVFQRILFE